VDGLNVVYQQLIYTTVVVHVRSSAIGPDSSRVLGASTPEEPYRR